MNEPICDSAEPIRLRRYVWALAVLWTIAVGTVLTWELLDERHHAMQIGLVTPGAEQQMVTEMAQRAAGYVTMWLLGIAGVAMAGRHLRRQIRNRQRAEGALQESQTRLQEIVAERTAELEAVNRELQKEIAERQQAEQWLLVSEERFRGYFELGSIGMAILSAQRDWIEVNHQLCDMLGYTEEELVRKPFGELSPGEDLQSDRAKFDRMLSGVINQYSIDKRFVRKDGEILDTLLSVKCLHNGDGKVDCLIVLVQDITDRKVMELALRSLSARYEAILAAVPDIIVEVDARQVYTWANRSAIEFFGDALLGKPASHYFEGEHDAPENGLAPPSDDEKVYYVEHWHRRRDGQKRLLGWWCRVLHDVDGKPTGVLSSAHDVTDRVRTESPPAIGRRPT